MTRPGADATRPHSSAPRILAVVVVVPARDESALVEACLRSIVAARDTLLATSPEIAVRMLLVADNCTDDTASLASRFPGVDVLTTAAGRVGVARATGVETGLRSLGHLPDEAVWTAHTDADSAVPSTWLVSQISLADDGADVVIGTVRPDPDDLTPEQNAHWESTHERGRPNGHVHGANLGVRASAYRAARGFDGVGEHEDNLLVNRLRLGGATVVASGAAEVVTSGRLTGRTPGGYAAHLAATLPMVGDLEESA